MKCNLMAIKLLVFTNLQKKGSQEVVNIFLYPLYFRKTSKLFTLYHHLLMGREVAMFDFFLLMGGIQLEMEEGATLYVCPALHPEQNK